MCERLKKTKRERTRGGVGKTKSGRRQMVSGIIVSAVPAKLKKQLDDIP